MGADLYGLPQMEPYFTTMFVPTAQFDDLLKSTRNILIVDINEHKYTHIKATKARDVWSQPQAMIRIQAPSNEEFLNYWKANGEQIREWFVQEELVRQLRFYRANTNKTARAKLNKKGYDLLIPEDFMLIMDTTLADVNVLWCCNNKGPMRKDIIVYDYPHAECRLRPFGQRPGGRQSHGNGIQTFPAGKPSGTGTEGQRGRLLRDRNKGTLEDRGR